jgi:hypothetical protein
MTSGKRLAIAVGIGMLSAFASLSTAQAQYGPRPYYGAPPSRGVYRSGLVLGGSLGVGAISASNCDPFCGGAGMIEGHIGGMLNPRLALMGDFWGSAHPWTDAYGSSGTTYHGIYTLAAQYWATDILRLKGGAGFGQMEVGYDGAPNNSESGFAIMGAIGVEVVQSYNFALDLQGRFGHGFYSQGGDVNNFGFMVGVNWY